MWRLQLGKRLREIKGKSGELMLSKFSIYYDYHIAFKKYIFTFHLTPDLS